MLTCAQEFIDKLNKGNFHYDVDVSVDDKGKERVYVNFPNDKIITAIVFSGDEGEYVSFFSHIESVPDYNYARVMVACNDANCEYKFCKFVVDEDGDLMDLFSAVLVPGHAGEVAFELLIRYIHIIDEVKPLFMREVFAARDEN